MRLLLARHVLRKCTGSEHVGPIVKCLRGAAYNYVNSARANATYRRMCSVHTIHTQQIKV